MANGTDLDRLRRRVVFERILARLATATGERWILKGGFALEVRLGDRARATRYLDVALGESTEDGADVRDGRGGHRNERGPRHEDADCGHERGRRRDDRHVAEPRREPPAPRGERERNEDEHLGDDGDDRRGPEAVDRDEDQVQDDVRDEHRPGRGEKQPVAPVRHEDPEEEPVHEREEHERPEQAQRVGALAELLAGRGDDDRLGEHDHPDRERGGGGEHDVERALDEDGRARVAGRHEARERRADRR